MALTQPDFDPIITCAVNVNGITSAGLDLTFQLTDEQVKTWTDDDLAKRCFVLRDAVAAFCAPGSEVQLVVSWGSSSGMITENVSITVPSDKGE